MSHSSDTEVLENDANKHWVHIDIRGSYAAFEENLLGIPGHPIVVVTGEKFLSAINIPARKIYPWITRDYLFNQEKDIYQIPGLHVVNADSHRMKVDYQSERDRLYKLCNFIFEEGHHMTPTKSDDLSVQVDGDLNHALRIGSKLQNIYRKNGYLSAFGVSISPPYSHMACWAGKDFGGFYIYTREDVVEKLFPLDVEEFPGIAEVRADKLRDDGFLTIGDIASANLRDIQKLFPRKEARKEPGSLAESIYFGTKARYPAFEQLTML
jgi:hypothetical protein